MSLDMLQHLNDSILYEYKKLRTFDLQAKFQFLGGLFYCFLCFGGWGGGRSYELFGRHDSPICFP